MILIKFWNLEGGITLGSKILSELAGPSACEVISELEEEPVVPYLSSFSFYIYLGCT